MARKAQELNIFRIAEEAGVSVATVSRVANRRNGVGEATRKRIYDLMTKYNFTPNYTPSCPLRIAVIYPWTDLTDYFRKAMKGIYDYAEKNDLIINIISAQSHRKESLLEIIRNQQCSGVVALFTENYRKAFESLIETDLPTIIIDSVSDDKKIGFIDNDSYSGSCAAAKHLIDLGHRNVGYLTYGNPSLNQLQRFKGAENTFKAHNIMINQVLTNIPESLVRGEIGYSVMQTLLRQSPNITAVMTVDDSMALGAMAAIHDAGLRIPEDISVIGFDNYAETAFWYPGLTTVDHPIEKAGYMAIEAIHAGLKNPTDWVPLREILPTSLVIRKSTGPALTKTTK